MTAQADSASFLDDDRRQRHQLRQQLRRQRRLLPATIRLHYARLVATHLQRVGYMARDKRIGVYLALPEEMSLMPFITRAWARHCRLYVPHITHLRERRMSFLPLTPTTQLRKHRWGMLEPVNSACMKAVTTQSLDAVLVPLVGFDAYGHRLGMGAGFYDRHLARRTRATSLRRPLLIGVAFSAQQSALLPHAAHDVGLDAVVTEQGFRRFPLPQ